MAIEKSNVKVAAASVSKLDAEFSVGNQSRESMSSDEDELLRGRNSVDSEDDEEFDDADSGAGSDDFDMLELGEAGSEFCQVGDQTCCVPYELYDLPDLHRVLSLEVWNECLTEEERFSLTKYLPDMDQETFMHTLKELFEGANFHFGNPIDQLYQMLKGGLCEPRVALYRQGLNFFHIHQHYHLLRKHQNSMVSSFLQMKEAWQHCKGYSIEEKLRVLNFTRSQKSLMGEMNEDLSSDYSGREESAEALWNMRSKGRFSGQKAVEVFSRDRAMAFNPIRGGAGNPVISRGGKTDAYEVMAGSGDDEQGRMYNMVAQRDWNAGRGMAMDQGQLMKTGKNREALRSGIYDNDIYSGRHPSAKTNMLGQGRNGNINQLSDIKVLTAKPSNAGGFSYPARRAKFVEPVFKDRMGPMKGRTGQYHANFADVAEPYWSKKSRREPYFPDNPSFVHEYRDGNSRKMKLGRDFSDPKMSDQMYPPEKRAKIFQDNVRGVSLRNKGPGMFPRENGRMFHDGEGTESDSYDQEEEEDINPSIMPTQVLHGHLENSFSSSSGLVFGKDRRAKRCLKGSSLEVLPASNTMGDFGRHEQMQEMGSIYLKSRQDAKRRHLDPLHSFAPRFPEDYFHSGSGNPNAGINIMPAYKVLSNGQVQPELGGVSMSVNNVFPVERRVRGNVTAMLKSGKVRDYSLAEDGGLYEGNPSGVRGRGFDGTLLGCTSDIRSYKRKENPVGMDEHDGSDYMHSDQLVRQIGSPDAGSSEVPVIEARVGDPELEIKPQKKPAPLITPTVHTDFSFSVIHLLSAVRIALIALKPRVTDNSSEAQKLLEKLGTELDDTNSKHGLTNGSLDPIDVKDIVQPEQTGSLPLTAQEIVDRVRSNPLDPRILETEEPLQDLVRGVLKVFSSKTAPLGAKNWKPLICYDRSTKSWSWTGPTTQNPTDNELLEEVTDPEAWKIPRKMLVKLVDSFANWLKCGQETLRQIGSLPAPPSELLQLNFDEKERFRDLRAQKSLNTINPSSDEVRAYFRKEELLRYSVPDRAFSYTAADGKKSIVAALRRCGGKPTSKARDHFMLKKDRPPHVTILCLVRDAAARLPGSIGTRADVCTLIRDSQYIVEDVTDTQVNGVVSGALDRLHYERDPCVQFDGERKLWVYLHREREEEDFEDDGTSSTKKWKRQKKDAVEQDEQVTVAHSGSVKPVGLDLSSDHNAEPPCENEDIGLGVACDDTRQISEDDLKSSHKSEQGAMLDIVLQGLEKCKNENLDVGT